MRAFKRKKPYYKGLPSVVEARPYYDRENYGQHPQEGDKPTCWKVMDQWDSPRYLTMKEFEVNFMPYEDFSKIDDLLTERLEEG